MNCTGDSSYIHTGMCTINNRSLIPIMTQVQTQTHRVKVIYGQHFMIDQKITVAVADMLVVKEVRVRGSRGGIEP